MAINKAPSSKKLRKRTFSSRKRKGKAPLSKRQAAAVKNLAIKFPKQDFLCMSNF